MLDIHAHILPDMDDGAQTQEQALEMLEAARSIGVDVLVVTPRVTRGYIDHAGIMAAYTWLKPYAKVLGIRLLLGYEISYNVLLDAYPMELKRLCITGTNTLMLDFSGDRLFPEWDYALCDLVKNGYEPVIVHPEQYVYIQEHPEMIAEMKRYGCKIQICAQALLKPIWSVERKTVGKFLRMGWVDYIASDARCPDDYWIMRHAVHRLKGRLPKESNSIAHMRSFPSVL